jgi:hypothetical protein
MRSYENRPADPSELRVAVHLLISVGAHSAAQRNAVVDVALDIRKGTRDHGVIRAREDTRASLNA